MMGSKKTSRVFFNLPFAITVSVIASVFAATIALTAAVAPGAITNPTFGPTDQQIVPSYSMQNCSWSRWVKKRDSSDEFTGPNSQIVNAFEVRDTDGGGACTPCLTDVRVQCCDLSYQ